MSGRELPFLSETTLSTAQSVIDVRVHMYSLI